MKILVTGAAGFIGSNLVDALLQRGCEVVGLDNLSTGFKQHLETAEQSSLFKFVKGDALDDDVLDFALRGCAQVFHLSANADVRFGWEYPRRDTEQNTLVTLNVLEAMRRAKVTRIAFASTGSLYGECPVTPTPEDAPFPLQTSLYAASKVACEGLVQAYCEGFGFCGHIFRFVSILGERYSHGHVFDFCRTLQKNPGHIRILGDGTQRKSYLYVGDCVSAMLCALDKAPGKINIFNLGVDEFCTVRQSLAWICERLGVTPEVETSGGDRGWIGDNPFVFLDCSRIRSLGWKPQLDIRAGVERTVDYLSANPWLLEART